MPSAVTASWARWLLLSLCAWGAIRPAHAATTPTAVIPVDADRSGSDLPVAAAGFVRAALDKAGAQPLSLKSTQSVMMGYLKHGGTDVSVYQARLKQAEEAMGGTDPNRAVGILEALIGDLAVDPDFSTEKQQLLESARLKLASRLLGLSGPRETGRGESPHGEQAKAVLVDALRGNPALAPSPAAFPPRFHMLLAEAQKALATQKRGGLVVDSIPRGASILLEGRLLGTTPLNLGSDALPEGPYRVWVEKNGAKSVPRHVVIEPRTTREVAIDLAFEAALWIDGPGLHPLPGDVLPAAPVEKLGRLLGTESLLLVGVDRSSAEAWLWAAQFQVRTQRVEQALAVRLPSNDALADAAQALGAAFVGQRRADVQERALPQELALVVVEPQASSPNESLSPVLWEDSRWLVIGGATAAGALVTAGIVAGVLLTTPVKGGARVSVEGFP